MFDLNKLSYKTYGNLVILVLLFIALFFNLFPFSFVEFILCISQIPLYLFARANLDEPIHANGLNICFVLTIIFYVFLYITIKVLCFLIGIPFAFMFSMTLTVFGCYLTSTKPNKQEERGKLFFGYKKRGETKYQKLVEYIMFNGLNPKLIESEERLKELDTQTYLIYKRKFRENKTFNEIFEEFGISNARIVETLDKAYFYMIGSLGI